MQLIALSHRSRSGVWDLTTGRQVFLLHGLYGAWFADDTALFADFPKDDKTKQPRNMLRFNVKTRTGAIAYRVPDGSGSSNRDVKSKNGKDKGNDEDSPKWSGYQVGRLLCTWRPSVKRGSLEQNVDLEMSEIATGKPLWSRHFAKERPRLFWDPQSGELIFAWQLSTSAAKQETSNDPSLHSKVAALSDRETAVLLEVVSGETGKDIGRILLDTGKVSFRITDVEANRDIVKVRDDQNRIILYSLASGKQFGVLFGDESSISKDGATLAVFNGQYELALYSLPDLRKRDTLRFPERITWLRFGRDAKSLFVLTRDQTAYTLDITP